MQNIFKQMTDRAFLINLLSKKKVRQVISLYFAVVVSTALGIVMSVVNTRLLGPEQYGDFKYLQTLFGFFVFFPALGIFFSGGRLLAQKENDSIKPQIFGVMILYALLVSTILTVFFFVFSFFQDRLFNNQLGWVIRLACPLLFIFPFINCLEHIMQGDNRIYEMSIFKIAPRLLYLVGVFALFAFFPLTLTTALGLFLVSFAVSIAAMVVRLKPRLENVKRYAAMVWKENKTYGFQLYIGQIVGVASERLGSITIAYFIDNTHVGFYALALTVSNPLAIIPSTVGTTFFKDFASKDRIPLKITLMTLALSGVALLLFLLLIDKLFLFLYSERYIAAIPLIYVVAIGYVIRGLGDFVNRFLGSHGLGKDMRNGAVVVGIFNIGGYFLLISALGVKGAAFARLIADVVYLGMMFYYYKRYTARLRAGGP